jgi:hypothetical protein
MLVIMIKDSNLMCHDFNLLQTLVTITETHWRRVNRKWVCDYDEGKWVCDYDEREMGRSFLLPSSLILQVFRFRCSSRAQRRL